jgi:hypothetical protein
MSTEERRDVAAVTPEPNRLDISSQESKHLYGRFPFSYDGRVEKDAKTGAGSEVRRG